MIIAGFLVLMLADTLAEPLRIPILVWDTQNHKHTLHFGYHPGATYGFDDVFGEMPIPPTPSVQAFDVRFLDLSRRKQFPGDGAYVDIRPFQSRTQTDTFFVRAQPANGSFPVTFSWPEGLGEYFDTILLTYHHEGSTHTIDMTEQLTFALMGTEHNFFAIVTSGLKGKLPWMN